MTTSSHRQTAVRHIAVVSSSRRWPGQPKGISAGVDMALHLVARLAGVDRAREVRRGIQYDPAPPF